MYPQKMEIKQFVQLSLLVALIILMTMIPFLGYIPITPAIRATTIHIPVIVGGILFGARSGAILGFVFGLTSLLTNTFTPNITSFVFTPFYLVGEVSGNWSSLIICFVPRILVGVVASYVYRALSHFQKTQRIACFVAAISSSLTNTILVLTGIYLFFGEAFASVKQVAYDALFSVLFGLVALNGFLEAVVAALLTVVIVNTSYKFHRK